MENEDTEIGETNLSSEEENNRELNNSENNDSESDNDDKQSETTSTPGFGLLGSLVCLYGGWKLRKK